MAGLAAMTVSEQQGKLLTRPPPWIKEEPRCPGPQICRPPVMAGLAALAVPGRPGKLLNRDFFTSRRENPHKEQNPHGLLRRGGETRRNLTH